MLCRKKWILVGATACAVHGLHSSVTSVKACSPPMRTVPVRRRKNAADNAFAMRLEALQVAVRSVASSSPHGSGRSPLASSGSNPVTLVEAVQCVKRILHRNRGSHYERGAAPLVWEAEQLGSRETPHDDSGIPGGRPEVVQSDDEVEVLKLSLDALIQARDKPDVLGSLWFDACRAGYAMRLYSRCVELYLVASAQAPGSVSLEWFIVDAAYATGDPESLLQCIRAARSLTQRPRAIHAEMARPKGPPSAGGLSRLRGLARLREQEGPAAKSGSAEKGTSTLDAADGKALESFVTSTVSVWRAFWRCALLSAAHHRRSRDVLGAPESSASASDTGLRISDEPMEKDGTIHGGVRRAQRTQVERSRCAAQEAFDYLLPDQDFGAWWSWVCRAVLYFPGDDGEAVVFSAYFHVALAPLLRQSSSPKCLLTEPALASAMMHSTRRGRRHDLLDDYMSLFYVLDDDGSNSHHGWEGKPNRITMVGHIPGGSSVERICDTLSPSPPRDAVLTAYMQCLLEARRVSDVATLMHRIRLRHPAYSPTYPVISAAAKVAGELRDEELAVWCMGAALGEFQSSPPSSRDLFRCLVALAKCHNRHFPQILQSVIENELLRANEEEMCFLQLLYQRRNVHWETGLPPILGKFSEAGYTGLSERNAGLVLRILHEGGSLSFGEHYFWFRRLFPLGSELEQWCSLVLTWASQHHSALSAGLLQEILEDVEKVRQALQRSSDKCGRGAGAQRTFTFPEAVEATYTTLRLHFERQRCLRAAPHPPHHVRLAGECVSKDAANHEALPPALTIGSKAGNAWVRVSTPKPRWPENDPLLRFAHRREHVHSESAASVGHWCGHHGVDRSVWAMEVATSLKPQGVADGLIERELRLIHGLAALSQSYRGPGTPRAV